MLSAEGVWVGSLLDLIILVTHGDESGAGDVAGLIDEAADGRREYLAAAREAHGRLGQRYARAPAQLLIDSQQQGQILVHGNGKRIDAAGRHPVGYVTIHRGERYVVLFCHRGSARDFDR